LTGLSQISPSNSHEYSSWFGSARISLSVAGSVREDEVVLFEIDDWALRKSSRHAAQRVQVVALDVDLDEVDLRAGL
jgi:hypothetical protein